ncbi:MAG: 4-hydroxy-3-methylbut-2-enyl diphosphate reductase [Clostridia bacterium]|nr:4-hydroxy-3-methylbut-2-enyl diphosphate reductase [Clostridia bacterium]
MNIYINRKHFGYCAGVQNAIRLALENKGDNVYCYGKLVHNNNVVNWLENQGIKTIDDITTLNQGDTIIIRAHGVPRSIYEYCKDNNINIIDATCKNVKLIQTRARKYYLDGYQIVLIGDKNHDEIIGINGWCDYTAVITDGTSPLDLSMYEKVLVMYQTTYDLDKVSISRRNLFTTGVKTLVIYNTICYTTVDRQSYIRNISGMCDLVVVVGDSASSNTKKLVDIAQQHCNQVALLSSVDNFPSLSNNQNICIVAGASTPQELTEEVLSHMVEQAKENNLSVEINEEFAKAVSKIPAKRSYKKGQKVKGHVVQIDPEGVTINLSNTKGDGFIPNEELAEENWQEYKSQLKVGDIVECIVISTDKIITLSKKEIDILYKDDALVSGIKEGDVFELVMTKAVKGGLLSKLGSYTVFVPSSHIRDGFVKNLEQYVGKKLRLIALPEGVDDTKKKIVASQREIIVREKQAKEDNFWNNIEVDEIVEGKVLRFSPFGAFINVRGFDCLAHLSDLSWTPVKDPAEVLELGKTYEFVVLKTDRETKRVSVGYKQLQPHPWTVAAEKFQVGTVVQGRVARILSFGAFIELDKGIDGLLHISNVSWDWLGDINEVLKVGDIIDVQVIGFDLEEKRITLSRKATMEKPDQPRTKADAEEHSDEEQDSIEQSTPVQE